jgi:enamine deaminase RidA (YjgF/YER057c/UK114 family)
VIDMETERRLRELDIELPEPPAPRGNYARGVAAGGLLFLSGQFPIRDGALVYAGRVGAELSPEDGYRAAALAAANVLGQLKALLGNLDLVREIVRVDGHVASAPGFFDQPKVLDGASDFLVRALPGRAGHARTAYAHPALPMNAAVELAAIVSIAGAGG